MYGRGRQSDVEGGGGVGGVGEADLLEMLPDYVGLIEIGRHQLRRQDVDLLPLAEQRGDALGFLLDVQSMLLLIFTTEARRSGREKFKLSSPRRPGPIYPPTSG